VSVLSDGSQLGYGLLVLYKPNMKPQLHSVSAFLLHFVVSATIGTNSTNTGCNLHIPKVVQDHMEAEGEPLLITFIFQPLFVRDVPESGGSFGVDFM